MGPSRPKAADVNPRTLSRAKRALFALKGIQCERPSDSPCVFSFPVALFCLSVGSEVYGLVFRTVLASFCRVELEQESILGRFLWSRNDVDTTDAYLPCQQSSTTVSQNYTVANTLASKGPTAGASVLSRGCIA